jgi:hypothetical protein
MGIDIEIGRGVRRALDRVRERAVSVDLTLRFCGGLVVKEAFAYPGTEDETAGFQCQRVGDLDVYWRQRLVVEGADAAPTSAVEPRRLTVRVDGDELAAEVAYA